MSRNNHKSYLKRIDVAEVDKSINKIILAHIKSFQFNQDKPLDDMAWQNTEKNIQIPSWREGNSGTVRC